MRMAPDRPRPALARISRLCRLFWHVLAGLRTLKREFPVLDAAARRERVQAWSLRALELFGVELVVQGQAHTPGPLLLVCNHVSWLDILVLNAAAPSRFVSKSDVRGWPVLGRLVEGAGTLFIERASQRDALRVVHHMAEELARGERLSVFPEGTTGDGHSVLPFHANLLQAALAADAPVGPVGLRYLSLAAPDVPSPAPAYVGEDTLLQSMWRTLGEPSLQARLRYGDPQHAAGRHRRAWAEDLRAEVARLMG